MFNDYRLDDSQLTQIAVAFNKEFPAFRARLEELFGSARFVLAGHRAAVISASPPSCSRLVRPIGADVAGATIPGSEKHVSAISAAPTSGAGTDRASPSAAGAGRHPATTSAVAAFVPAECRSAEAFEPASAAREHLLPCHTSALEATCDSAARDNVWSGLTLEAAPA
jgi:hypothetical protein